MKELIELVEDLKSELPVNTKVNLDFSREFSFDITFKLKVGSEQLSLARTYSIHNTLDNVHLAMNSVYEHCETFKVMYYQALNSQPKYKADMESL